MLASRLGFGEYLTASPRFRNRYESDQEPGRSLAGPSNGRDQSLEPGSQSPGRPETARTRLRFRKRDLRPIGATEGLSALRLPNG
jgi:hypothetical protein